MKRFLMRWFLLNKRLFKKPVFVIILCTVPVLIAALNVVTQNTEGFIKITLAMEDPSDMVAQQVVSELVGSSEIVSFSPGDSPEEAAERVKNGETDAAWIISADLAEHIESFVNGTSGGVCVSVVERKETVSVRIAREKLAAALSSDACFELMCKAYYEKVGAGKDKAELRGYYDRAMGSGDLFEFRYSSGEAVDDDSSYLMLPVRGMLAIAILLAGFAMAMFRVRDEEQMVFAGISRAARPAFELGYHLTGIIDIAVVVLISLYLSGSAGPFPREAASMAVYCLNCAVFVILIRCIFRRAGSIAALTPLVILLMIVINPILFNLPFVYPIRLMTPVYYYLQSVHDPSFILYGLIYFAAVSALCLILAPISERRIRK